LQAGFCIACVIVGALEFGPLFGARKYFYFVYFCGLVALGTGTFLSRPWARLGLSLALVFQTFWLAWVFVMASTEGHRHGCDFSCYVGPLEQIAIPAVLCLIAAWVVFPGCKRPAK